MKSNILTEIWTTFRSLGQIICPRGKEEKAILVLSMVYFLLFSMVFACNVDVTRIPKSTGIMGYDTWWNIEAWRGGERLALNKLHVWNIRHPFYVFINIPALLVAGILGENTKWCVFAFFSSLIMSLSNLLIYKICKTYDVPKCVTCCALLLFSSFAHVILLASQAETFSYTMCFSLLAILAVLMKEDDKCKDNVLFLLLAGTTITNVAKFFMLKFCKLRGVKNAVIESLRSAWFFYSSCLSNYLDSCVVYLYTIVP